MGEDLGIFIYGKAIAIAMRTGLIGGTGIYYFDGNPVDVETPYGTVELTHAVRGDKEIFFLPRHGKGHGNPPHRINYRANIQALKNCGVERIIAVSTVGSMKKKIRVGSLFIPNDFIDFTKRKSTFFDDEVVHVDMSRPFCPEVREALLKTASRCNPVFEGVYASTEGPRFETKAEIAMMGNFADVVGMTLVPEVTLARERGMCYASLCIVANMAAGLQENLPADEIVAIYEKMKKTVMLVVNEAVDNIPDERKCRCMDAVARGRM
ncbi:MAG: MTAP family purine nucleoside phosphorylase [Candidatus Thermoplasmatota archaeon]|nr:MTAP family purine nucleoside phosphorylase [Candidatus Thermoplasmatota archaeon]